MKNVARIEGPGLREQIAVAAHTADLSPTGRSSGLMAALGASAMSMAVDVADGRLKALLTPVGTARINPSRRLAALLERAKYARDRTARSQAVILFAHYLARKRGWCDRQRIRRKPDVLYAFAAMVVTEWMYDRCAQCGGSGRIRLDAASANARTELCGVCGGSGMAIVDHGARASVIGLPMEKYQAHWEAQFDDALRWLAEIEASNIGALQSQLRRDTLNCVGK